MQQRLLLIKNQQQQFKRKHVSAAEQIGEFGGNRSREDLH